MDRVCLGSARRVPERLSVSQISEVLKPRFRQSFQAAAVRPIAPLSPCECVEFRKRRAGCPRLAGGCETWVCEPAIASSVSAIAGIRKRFSPASMAKNTGQRYPYSQLLVEAMTHEELQELRERLLQSRQQQRARSRLQKILDRILKRVTAMLESEEKQPQPVSQSDDSGRAA